MSEVETLAGLQTPVQSSLAVVIEQQRIYPQTEACWTPRGLVPHTPPLLVHPPRTLFSWEFGFEAAEGVLVSFCSEDSSLAA
jgi:hypothetical protein